MAYLVLAYPEIAKPDFELIQDYRRTNDELFYSVVEPHFTIVFPVFDFSEKEFRSEVRATIDGFGKFDFVLRCGTINKDAFSDYFHAFLVPDEGYSQVTKLHYRLYSGKLKDNLRLDIDFIPHLGVGNSMDKYKCKRMVDEWNERDFEIKGSVSELAIVNYEDNKVERIEVLELR